MHVIDNPYQSTLLLTLGNASYAGLQEMFTGMSIIAYNAASEAHNLSGLSYANGYAFKDMTSVNVKAYEASLQQSTAHLVDNKSYDAISYSHSNVPSKGNQR